MTRTIELVRGILSAWKKNLKRLLPLMIISRLLVISIMLPLLEKSVRQTLKMTGYSYLTPKNIAGFIFHPFTLLVLLIWVLAAGFLSYLDFLTLTYFFHIREQKLSFRFQDMLSFCIHSFRHPWKRRLPGQFMLALLQEFLYLLMLLAFLMQRIRIPNYIWNSLKDIRAGWIFVVVLVLVLLVLAFIFQFSLLYCFLEGRSAGEAAGKSRRLLRGNVFQTLVLFLSANAVFAFFMVLLYLGILAVAAAVIHFTASPGLALNTFLVVYDKINWYFGLLISILAVYLNQGMLTHLYYRFKDVRNELTSKEEMSEYIEVNKVRLYMYLSRILIALVAVMGAYSLYDIIFNDSFHPEDFFPVISITSHRGQSVEAPENTMPAIEKAAEQLSDYAEIDVRLTSDGVPVLMHDASVRRTTGKSGKVSDMTLAEIEKLDAGYKFGSEFAGTKVPTFDEVLTFCKGTLKLNVELKPSGDEKELAEKAMELINAYDFSQQCIISSANRKVLRYVKEIDENMKVGLIITGVYGDFYEKEEVDFFSIRSDFVTRYMAERIHSMGRELHVWTINTRSEMERMKNMGVDNIITDDAVLAREVLSSKEEGDSFLDIMRMILNE